MYTAVAFVAGVILGAVATYIFRSKLATDIAAVKQEFVNHYVALANAIEKEVRDVKSRLDALEKKVL